MAAKNGKGNNHTELPREQQLVRFAKSRAMISLFLTEHGGEFTKSELYEQLKTRLTEIKTTKSNFESDLYYMVKHDFLRKDESDIGYPTYSATTSSSSTKGNVVKVKHKGKIKRIQVDIIKATGKVRVTIDDLEIDLGVI